jgi:Zn-dependent protease with chaperone function
MIAALLLACYAASVGLLGPLVLSRGWAERSPRFAIALWLILPGSWVLATALAVLGLTSSMPATWSLPYVAGAPAAAHWPPGGRAVTIAGLVVAAALLMRAAGCLVSGLVRVRRERAEHSAFLLVAGRPDASLGAIVLEDETPAAYCLPAGDHRVVVSSGTIASLRRGQLTAVLAHERAHLRGRHHAMLAWAAALGRAFPFVPLLRRAPGELAALAEMAADDVAARQHDADDLASALVLMAQASVKIPALRAGGPAAVKRIHRLLAPATIPSRPARTAKIAAGIGALTLPAAITLLGLLVAGCSVHP